jgi:hypothetical protein
VAGGSGVTERNNPRPRKKEKGKREGVRVGRKNYIAEKIILVRSRKSNFIFFSCH